MKIQITDHRPIFTVQEEFNTYFPHLKIKFFGKPSKVGDPPSKRAMNDSKSLGDCRVVHNKGNLTLSPSMSVADLKQTLSDAYGLSIAVYRKSGTRWVETATNDSFSLGEQEK